MDPIFNGPALIGFLALIIALSVYLRTVAVSAHESIIDIYEGKYPNTWPTTAGHSALRIDTLKALMTTIQIAGRMLFVLLLFTAFRFLLWAIWPLFDEACATPWFRGYDALLVGTFSVAMGIMWRMHIKAQARETQDWATAEAFARDKATKPMA